MGPLAIDARTGVTHDTEFFPLLHRLSGFDRDGIQMPVEAVVWTSAKAVFHDHVTTVIGMASHLVGIHHRAARDRPDLIKRLPARVPAHRLNVHSFVETSHDCS